MRQQQQEEEEEEEEDRLQLQAATGTEILSRTKNRKETEKTAPQQQQTNEKNSRKHLPQRGIRR
jgi:hypothetical protein